MIGVNIILSATCGAPLLDFATPLKAFYYRLTCRFGILGCPATFKDAGRGTK